MSTLVLRLSGALQSWGTGASKLQHRDTAGLPTKSAVVGLLANAMGRDRRDDITDLAAARFGARTELGGERTSDYHTARVDTSNPLSASQVTNREYLMDADFTVFVELGEHLAEEVASALRAPARQLYLGRRSCPPDGPVLLDVLDVPVEEAMSTYPSPHGAIGGGTLIDHPGGDGVVVELADDQPVTFTPEHRKHSLRTVLRSHAEPVVKKHDPMSLLEEACTSPKQN